MNKDFEGVKIFQTWFRAILDQINNLYYFTLKVHLLFFL